MIVLEARGIGRHRAQVPRHPEVQEQRAGLEAQQQVLGTPPDALDAPAGELSRELARHGPAQSRFVDLQGDDAALAGVGRKAPPRGLDFG